MEYTVDYKKMADAAHGFILAENSMRSYAKRLENIKNQIADFPQLQSFNSRVESRVKAAYALADSFKAFGVCLTAIRQEYLDAEKKVNIITKIINWFKNLLGIRNKGGEDGKNRIPILPIPVILPEPEPKKPPKPKPPPAPPPPPPPKPPPKPAQPKPPPTPRGMTLTPEELEADLRMYREARALEAKYQSIWRNAKTVEQKQAVLTAFLAELQQMMGTSANPNINFTHTTGYAGLYSPGTHSISVNMNHRWFNSPDALKVIMHEVRHAYQAEAAGIGNIPRNHNHQVSDERARIWKDNWNAQHFYDLQCRDAAWFADQKVW